MSGAQHAIQRRLVQARSSASSALERGPSAARERAEAGSDLEHLPTRPLTTSERTGRRAEWRRRCVRRRVHGRRLLTLLILASSREWPRPGGRGCPMTWINSAVRRRARHKCSVGHVSSCRRRRGTSWLQSRRGSHSRRIAAPDGSGGVRRRPSPLESSGRCPSRGPSTSTVGGRRATPVCSRGRAWPFLPHPPRVGPGSGLARHLVPSPATDRADPSESQPSTEWSVDPQRSGMRLLIGWEGASRASVPSDALCLRA